MYRVIMAADGHKAVVWKTGLIIWKKFPFIGGSSNGIVNFAPVLASKTNTAGDKVPGEGHKFLYQRVPYFPKTIRKKCLRGSARC